MRKIPKARKHVGVTLDVNVWRNIKIEATRNDMTLTDWVEQSLVSSLERGEQRRQQLPAEE
jgi:macrodomain Ter protein organizer (MatP/YcbG family)